MIDFIDMEAENVVGMKVDGKIEDQEFDAVVALFEKKMQHNDRVRLYIEMESFKGFSPKTFLKDLKFGLENWDRFDKEAVVTEQKWVQKLADIGGKVFSNIEVKAFSFDEREQAKVWIQS
jgi:hypothetical protein